MIYTLVLKDTIKHISYIMTGSYLFSNQVSKALKVCKDSTFQMVLGTPG